MEREFEIMGEAIRRLKGEDAATAARITNAAKILGFRNVLAHGYDAIRDSEVWTIVADYVPTLLGEVSDLMREEP